MPGVEAGPGGARGHSQTLRTRTAAGGVKSKDCGPPRASRLPRNPPTAPLEKVTAGRGQQVDGHRGPGRRKTHASVETEPSRPPWSSPVRPAESLTSPFYLVPGLPSLDRSG